MFNSFLSILLMNQSSDSSTDSSIDSNIVIRRIPRYEIVSELTYNTDSSYSPASVSTMSNDSPVRRNIPRAVRIPDLEAQAEIYYDDDEYSIGDSIYSFYRNDEDKKPFFYKYITIVIWLSYLIGVFSMSKVKFTTVSPENESLYFRIISKYPNCDDLRGEIWRFFTSSLVHGDIGHIIINTIFLHNQMYLLELIQGYKNLICLLLTICLYTGFIFSYFNPYSSAVGCSHLVFGYTGALLADFIINYKHLEGNLKFILFFSIFLVTMIEVISYNFLFSDSTAYEAHWAGWLSGLLFGLSVFKDRRTDSFNIRSLIIGLNLLTCLTVFCLYSYITNWPPEYNNFIRESDLPFCCYEKLVKNNTNLSCYV